MELSTIKRVRLASLPTAVEPADRLTEVLGGKVRVWLKRDDTTGLAIGGNKARKLEFLLAEAVALGSDTVITTGGPQSNHCRMTAAAAAKLGLDCHLVFSRPDCNLRQGNLILDELLGAKLHFRAAEDVSREMSNLAEELGKQGKRPYLIPLGGSNQLGALGYALAVDELLDQMGASTPEFNAFVHASGSGGTQAGLLVGKLLHNLETEVIGVSVSRSRAALEQQVGQLAGGLLSMLGKDSSTLAQHVCVLDDYVGSGYGLKTEASQEALRLLASTEGVILDPVYTAKGMAGLIHQVRSGRWPVGSQVLFWHTGGSPALFADSIFWGE